MLTGLCNFELKSTSPCKFKVAKKKRGVGHCSQDVCPLLCRRLSGCSQRPDIPAQMEEPKKKLARAKGEKVGTDDEDGRCLLDLHALEESSGKPLSTEPSRPTTNVDPRLLEDEDLGSPSSSGVNLKNSQQPCNILQQPVHQVTTKPFGSNTAVTTQNKAALQQQKVQQNLSALTSKPGQNVVLLGFPQGLPSDTFKQPLPPQQRAPSKPRSVHLLSQGSSSSSATQHVAQAMLQGQKQILLPGQLAGACAVQIPQQLSALQTNMGRQIPSTSRPSGQAHTTTSQGPGARLSIYQVLPAHILSSQHVAGQLNLCHLLPSQSTPGTAHILWAPMQLQPSQVPRGILLQQKQQPPTSQAPSALGTCSATVSSGMVSRQGQAVAATATSGTPMQSHAPTAALPPSSAGKRRWDATCQRREPGPGPSKRAARSRPGISTSVPGDSRAFPSTSTLVSPGKGTAAQGRSGTAHARQQPVQYDSELHPKKASTLQPGKEACFLEQLHKHQAMVLHPDYRTPFRSLDDAVQRLLPYHIYQGTLPSDEECRKVDEEFEVVSAQLLKRSQAMLNKYRLLLLEESQRVSPSAEMVMIHRMFVQEERIRLALDKQSVKEKSEEDVSVLSPSHSLSSLASLASSSSAAPAPDSLKVPPAQAVPPTPSPKLEIKPSGSSPSVTCTKTPPLLDEDADTLPSGNKSPSQACGAPSQIGLKLKIKQRAGLWQAVHNTASKVTRDRDPDPGAGLGAQGHNKEPGSEPTTGALDQEGNRKC
ncbi:BRD4-interacting chromatin-remodeling complex-associated protein-like [Cuculus canorus]|uniref:BRD4-interacting chromatin-remodeling complex-associated protein-like n=1 Tax=Cuculus canorus TaxID=55661 RepID=UPI0023AA9ACF|nr:BRD4-interacting chromatin-remodeling complex-associated protein-like [Cuculus canorus]